MSSFQEWQENPPELRDNPSNRHPASAHFHRLVKEIAELHDSKQHDYGKATDPFANVRAAEDFGIEPWLGCVVRMNDKVNRIKSFATNGGKLKHEGVEDSLKDIAVYALIALVLFRESQ